MRWRIAAARLSLSRGFELFPVMKRTQVSSEPMREQPAISLVRLRAPTAEEEAAASRSSEPPLEQALDLDGLFRRYAPYVAAIAHRLLGRDEDVDDTIQEVFVAAVRGVHAVRD